MTTPQSKLAIGGRPIGPELDEQDALIVSAWLALAMPELLDIVRSAVVSAPAGQPSKPDKPVTKVDRKPTKPPVG